MKRLHFTDPGWVDAMLRLIAERIRREQEAKLLAETKRLDDLPFDPSHHGSLR